MLVYKVLILTTPSQIKFYYVILFSKYTNQILLFIYLSRIKLILTAQGRSGGASIEDGVIDRGRDFGWESPNIW